MPPCAPEFKQGVLNGATSDCIRALQRGLVLLENPALQIDGDFGPITDAAVKAFQSSSNLQVLQSSVCLEIAGDGSPVYMQALAIMWTSGISMFKQSKLASNWSKDGTWNACRLMDGSVPEPEQL